MAVYPSIYRAKAIQATATKIRAYVPQVFGDKEIEITDFLGPATNGMGWVFFQGGNPEFPVWSSGLGGGNGSAPAPTPGGGVDEVWIGPGTPSGEQELWYDTDEPAPIDWTLQDARYVNTTGDVLSGVLRVPGYRWDGITLNDDQAGYIPMVDAGAPTCCIMAFSGNVSSAGHGILASRCGDATAFTTVIAAVGGTVTAMPTPGTLTGATGTDGHLTFRADTATRRIYIENRVGAVRAWQFVLLSAAGSGASGPPVVL